MRDNDEDTAPHQTMPLVPQDHSQSVTVAGDPHPGSPPPATPPITLRIGRGVAAAERSRRIRMAAQRARTHAWRIGNLALTVLVVVAAIWAGWQWWQRWHPQLRVDSLNVTVATPLVACDSAYDVVGTISSNGKAGTLSYQWVRSDGAATDRLTVNIPTGQRTTIVHLHWTFTGAGKQDAAATLKLFKPAMDAVGRFSYACVS